MKSFTEEDDELLKKIRREKTIGVLMGGPSEERDISLKSGAAVLTHLSSAEYRAEPCDFKTEEELRFQLQEKRIDIAFLALHGKYGEDGSVQAFLESLKIPYTGSSPKASALAFDKWASRRYFEEIGLTTPGGIVLKEGESLPSFEFHYPIVVKPVCQGSSIGLSIVDSKEQLPGALREAFRHDRRILIEPYIQGSELTVGILGEEALPVIQILPAGRYYDYASKYISDKTQFLIPAPIEDSLTHAVQEASLKVHEALGCEGFSRVDLLLNKKNEPVILEVNTIPGLTSRSLLPRASEAVGISFLELCEKMILMALARKLDAQKSHAK